MAQKTSKEGLDFIARHESYGGVPVLKAYKDATGLWTIGNGTTVYPNGSPVKGGDVCTVDQALVYEAHDLAKTEAAVTASVKVPLTQSQFDALVSFTYNVGINAELHSTLLKLLNKGDYRGAASHFIDWDKNRVNGQLVVSKGLHQRRKDEAALFLRGVI